MGWQAAEAQIDDRLRRTASAAAKAPFVPGALVERYAFPHAEPGSVGATVTVGLGLGALGAASVLDQNTRR